MNWCFYPGQKCNGFVALIEPGFSIWTLDGNGKAEWKPVVDSKIKKSKVAAA